MENKLEQLLNSLIEKGWKPRGEKVYKTKKRTRNLIRYNKMSGEIYFYVLYSGLDNQFQLQRIYILRQLVSKESGLWQFVCENKLYNPDNRGYWGKNVTIVGEYPTLDGDENIGYRDYEYYLIESALCDEDKLEEFLLSNIKV